MPSAQHVTKATFTIEGQSEALTVQFNPVSLEHLIQNQLQAGGGQAAQFVASSSAKLTMELIFDTTDTGVDVRSVTQKVAQLMKPRGDGSDDAERRAPPVVTFGWGAFTFTGMVDSFKQVIDFFSSQGVPLRATVQLSMTAQDRVFDDVGAGDAATQPELELPGGDASSIAALGGAPGAARALASANGLESVRFGGGGSVTVGGGISIKPPAGFAPSGGLRLPSAGLQIGGQLSAGVTASAGAFEGLRASASLSATPPIDLRKLRAAVNTAATQATDFDVTGKAVSNGPSSFRADVGAQLRFEGE
jgi:hypothetical protein